MKKLLFLLALPLAAQTLTPTVSPASVAPGGTATVTVTLSGSQINALEWDANLGTLTSTNPLLGPAASIVNKGLSYSPAIHRTIVVGTTAAAQSPMQAGVVTTQSVTVPATAAAGAVSISLSNGSSASVTGQEFPVTFGPAAVLTVTGSSPPPPPPSTNPLDLNGDGVVNNLDFGIALNQALGIAPCSTADFSGPTLGTKDGKCDVADLVFLAKQI